LSFFSVFAKIQFFSKLCKKLLLLRANAYHLTWWWLGEVAASTALAAGQEVTNLHCTICGVTAAILPNRSLAAVASHDILLFFSTVLVCIPIFTLSTPISLPFFWWQEGEPNMVLAIFGVGFALWYECSEHDKANLANI
jgi:hypothetical protein